MLFEFVTRFTEAQGLEVRDPAEERVFCNVQCELERVLHEPLADDYRQRLEQAQRSVRNHSASND